MDEADAYLQAEHPGAPSVARWAVAAVRAADPEVGYVCGVFPGADGVRIFFEHGGALPDPDGLLRGEGLRGRWLAVTAMDDEAAAAVRGFGHDAIVRRVFR